MAMIDLSRAWWSVVLRGVAAVVFGIIALFWPPRAAAALLLVFSAYALVNGAFCLVSAVRAGRAGERWGALLLEAIASLAIGVITLFYPGATALALVYFVGAWALVTGVTEIATAIHLRKIIRGEWMMALAGVLSIALGILLFLSPVTGAIVITIWIGAYAVVFGALLIGLAIRLRTWQRQFDRERQIPSGPLPRPA